MFILRVYGLCNHSLEISLKYAKNVCGVCVLKAQSGDSRLVGALSSRCSSLSSINTSSGIDVESPPSDTASLSAQHLLRRYA